MLARHVGTPVYAELVRHQLTAWLTIAENWKTEIELCLAGCWKIVIIGKTLKWAPVFISVAVSSVIANKKIALEHLIRSSILSL